MQEVDTTHMWMTGVMLIMAGYAVIAIVGYLRRASSDRK